MPFLTDDDIESRLASPDNLVKRLEIHRCGKGHGDKTPVPIEIKRVIADIGNEDGVRGTDIAKAFGISKGLVSNIKNGQDSRGFRDENLHPLVQKKRGQVEGKRDQAEELAIDTVLESLGLLGSMVGEIRKPKDLSQIAKDMASVAEKIRGRGSKEAERQVHLHLYAPQMKKVEDYEVIDV